MYDSTPVPRILIDWFWRHSKSLVLVNRCHFFSNWASEIRRGRKKRHFEVRWLGQSHSNDKSFSHYISSQNGCDTQSVSSTGTGKISMFISKCMNAPVGNHMYSLVEDFSSATFVWVAMIGWSDWVQVRLSQFRSGNSSRPILHVIWFSRVLRGNGPAAPETDLPA